TAMLSFTFGDKRVVYASDLKMMPPAIFTGADIAIINGTFYERDHPAHMPLLKGIRTCRRFGVGRVIATHIGHLQWSNAELGARRRPRLRRRNPRLRVGDRSSPAGSE